MDATALDSMLRAAPVSHVVPAGTGLKTMRRIAELDRPLYDLGRWLGTSSSPRAALHTLMRVLDYQYPTTVPAKGETLATGGLLRAYFRAALRLTHKVRYWDRKRVIMLRRRTLIVCAGSRRGRVVLQDPIAGRACRTALLALIRGEDPVERDHGRLKASHHMARGVPAT
jgi:hypothetical protein